MKTTLVQERDVVRKWHVVDASEVPVGRMAVKIANLLRGRNKPIFSPHIDTGDFVIVINAAKCVLSGAKDENKLYQKFTGYPGGRQDIPVARVRERHPDRIVTHAVKGMLPGNHQGRVQLTRLKVYGGADHPHAAQQPEKVELL